VGSSWIVVPVCTCVSIRLEMVTCVLERIGGEMRVEDEIEEYITYRGHIRNFLNW
jgi:hypothetical protein